MVTFGTYRLSYEPPEGSLDASIDMTISAEANLSEMLSFFESFLRAATYPLGESHELGIERKAPDFDIPQDFWEDYNTSAPSSSFPGYPDNSITSVFPGVAVGNPPARNVFF